MNVANVVSSTLAEAPFFLQRPEGTPIYYSAADMTRYTAGIIGRSGILGSSHFLVTQAANVGMAIKVNSGYANVGGLYLVHQVVDQTIDLSGFDASPAATRTHKVFLSVYNALEEGDNEYAGKVEVVEDTGGGANPPADAAYTLQLATITVGPGQGNIQNANITNTVRHGGMAGEYVYLAGYLRSGFASAGDQTDGHDFRARYENGRVWLSGSIRRTTPTSTSPFANGGSYDFADMHSNLRPARTVYLSAPCSIYDSGSDSTGTYHWRLSITRDGLMNARLPTGTGPRYLMFDGLSYDLD